MNKTAIPGQRLTQAQAQEFLQISRPTLWRLRHSGELPFLKIGGSIRFKIEDLERVGQREVAEAAKAKPTPASPEPTPTPTAQAPANPEVVPSQEAGKRRRGRPRKSAAMLGQWGTQWGTQC